MKTQQTRRDEAVYSTLARDEDLAELVEMFVDELPDRLETLKSQFENSQWDELRRTAHQLKGAAGSYGFDQVTPLAARLERSVHERLPEDEIADALGELCRMCLRLRAGTA